MEQIARVAGMVDDVGDDVEAAHLEQQPSRKGAASLSRVPMPRRSFSTVGRRTPAASVHSRANSAHSVRDALPSATSTYPDAQEMTLEKSRDDGMDGEGLAWDAMHPCWPHPNPHVPRSSPLHRTTRVIRLQRDYRIVGDLYPAFETLYPEILEGCLSQEEFKELVRHINGMMQKAFDPQRTRAWADAVIGMVTGWLWEDAGLTGVRRVMREVDAWLETWNRDLGRPRGVEVISLRRTAFLSLDIQVPDPTAWMFPDHDAGEREAASGGGRLRTGTLRSEAGSTNGLSQSERTSGSLRRTIDQDGDVPPLPQMPRQYLVA